MKGVTKINGQVEKKAWAKFQAHFEINGHTKTEALTKAVELYNDCSKNGTIDKKKDQDGKE